MNSVDSSDLSHLRATGEEQKTGPRITDLPKDLLRKIFELLPPKNLSSLAGTCKIICKISKTTLEEKEKKFVEQKNKLTAYLKKILNPVANNEVFPKISEYTIKDSPNLDRLADFLYKEILWKVSIKSGVRQHTKLEDFSTIEFLDEILHNDSPIFFLEEEFCSKIPLESVDRLVDRRIQKYGFEQTYKDLLNELCGYPDPVPLLFCSRRLLIKHAAICDVSKVPKRFNDEKSFVLALVKQRKDFYFYASPRLQKDKDIVLAILQNEHDRPRQPSKYVPPELQDDPEIKALLKKYPDKKEFPD